MLRTGYSTVSLIPLILALSVTTVAQNVQEETQGQENSSVTEEQAQQQNIKPSIVKPSTEKKRYFIGERQKAAQQTGPKLAAPKSIIPQPFVPAGKIKIPAPATNSAANTVNDPTGLQNDLTSSTNPLNEQTDGDTLQTASNAQGSPDNAADDLNQTALSEDNQADTPFGSDQNNNDFFEEGTLSAIDPSKLAVLGSQDSFDASFWRGYSREQYITRLNDFRDNSGSPVMGQIARKIALSSADIPASDNPTAIDNTIRAKLSLLMAKGNAQDYQTLIDNLPKDHDWSNLAREFAQAHLLASRLSDACGIAEEQRKTDNSAYWLRLSAFCEAARGNRSAVDFQLGVLEEFAEIEPTFYRLIDHILIEAEENAAGTIRNNAQIDALEGALEINVLEAAMARLARVEINSFKLENVNPMAVGIMLSIPSVTDEAKIQLIQMALKQGWLTADDFKSFYTALSPSDDEKTAAVSFAYTDDNSDAVDATLANLVAVSDDETVRLNALENAWFRAAQTQTTTTAGPVFAKLTSNIPANAGIGSRAALFTRLALLENDKERSKLWLRTLRTRTNNDDPEADTALKNIWPIMVTTFETPFTIEGFNIWWDAQANVSDRYERANLLLSTMEAIGIIVPDTAWHVLESGPSTLNGEVPSPALWRAFLIAVKNDDKPKALTTGFRLLSPKHNGEASPSLVGSVLGNLQALGFHDEARMLATEILIAQGL
jgi:hypothetical protein